MEQEKFSSVVVSSENFVYQEQEGSDEKCAPSGTMCFFDFVQALGGSKKDLGKQTATTVFYEKLESGGLREIGTNSQVLSSTLEVKRIEQAIQEDVQIKELSIPEQFMEELIQLTSRRESTDEQPNGQQEITSEDRAKDWPQYLTEQEVAEMVRIMNEQERLKEDMRLKQLQEDGTFVNQYNSSVIEHNNITLGEQNHEGEDDTQLEYSKVMKPLEAPQASTVNTIMVDSQEVDVHQESVLNYEDMRLLNGQDDSSDLLMLSDPNQKMQQQDKHYGSFHQGVDQSSFNVSPVTPYQKLKEIKMRKVSSKPQILHQSKLQQRDNSCTSETRKSQSTQRIGPASMSSKRGKPMSEVREGQSNRGNLRSDKKANRLPSSKRDNIMTLEQKTKMKIHQILKKKKKNLIMKNQGFMRNQSGGPPQQQQSETKGTQISSLISPPQDLSRKLGFNQAQTQARVRNIRINDYFADQQSEVLSVANIQSQMSDTAQGKSFKDMMMLSSLGMRHTRGGNQAQTNLGKAQHQRPTSGIFQTGTSSVHSLANQIMLNGSQKNTDSFEMLDFLLLRDQQINGVEVYKRGDELKNGLIDIDKVYEVVLTKERERDPDFVSEVRGQITRQEKWKRVMAFMSKNPTDLLDALPNQQRIAPTTQQPITQPWKQQTSSKNARAGGLSDFPQNSKLKSKLQKDLDLSKKLKQNKFGVPTGNFFERSNQYQGPTEKPFPQQKQTGGSLLLLGTDGMQQLTNESPDAYSKKSNSRYDFAPPQSLMGGDFESNVKGNQVVDDQLSFGAQSHRQEQQVQKRWVSQDRAGQMFDKSLQALNDWKMSILSKRALEDHFHPYKYDASLYTNEDIDYMINMVRRNESTLIQKQWTATTLKQMINKVLHTIRTQCEELNLHRLADKICLHYHFVNTDNLIKLFFRCKEFFVIRSRLLALLSNINEREKFLESFQVFVKELNEHHHHRLNDEESRTTLLQGARVPSKERELNQMLQQLKELTESVASEIMGFIADYRKYFGKVFIYDGGDYLEVSRRETRDIEYVIQIIVGDNPPTTLFGTIITWSENTMVAEVYQRNQ